MVSLPAPPSAAADIRSGGTLISPRRRDVIFVALMLGVLLAGLGQTVVATALPTIVADLGDAEHQSWAVTSYLLGGTVVIAFAGKLGDLFGRKWVFLGVVLLFIVASVLCALSQSMTMLAVARALQGVGGGGISVTASALIGELCPLRERGRYQGTLGAVFGVTTVLGPLVGGYFTDQLSWRWAFWINVPVSMVVIVIAAAVIPRLPEHAKPVIDYLGILLVAVGATGLTLATTWGGTTYAWNSAIIIWLFIGSAAALAVFGWVESRVAAPVLPTRLFRRPVFAVCCALSFGVGFAMLGALTFLPTYLRYVDGVSATTAGLRTMPMVIGLLITSTAAGILVGRTGRYKVFPVAGTALMAFAFVLMSHMQVSTPAWVQSVYLVILGAGIGLSMQVLVLIVQSTMSFEDLGVATSGVIFFRTIGSSFGAATLGALFANFLGRRMTAALASSGASAEVSKSPAALHRLPHNVADPIVRAYAESFTQVFLWAGAVAVVGFILALCLREVPLTKIHGNARDLGDGFGMPAIQSPEELLETAIGRILHDVPSVRLRNVAGRPDSELDVAGLWGVVRIYQYERLFGTARLTHIAKHLGVPYEILEPTFERLVQTGYALRDDDTLSLTPSGVQQVDSLTALTVDWIVDHLAGSPGLEGQPDRDEVEAALERIASRTLVAGRTISP